MTIPRVSVSLPCFEGEWWLHRAIKSVAVQEGTSWELVVVDDGSSLSPEEIVQPFRDDRIRFYRIPHAGKCAALNRGAAESRAGLLCFLDQDDIMLPGRFYRQSVVFDDEPATEVAYSDYERVAEGGEWIDRFTSRQATGEECLRLLATGKALFSMQSLMLRRVVYEKVGGFFNDSDLTGLDDAEFLALLFASDVRLRYEPGVVQQWVRHERNYSAGASFREARLVLLKHLSDLSERMPELKEVLSLFRYHTYYMRGLYYLENAMPEKACPELIRAIGYGPGNWNAYYLLIKSWLKANSLKVLMG